MVVLGRIQHDRRRAHVNGKSANRVHGARRRMLVRADHPRPPDEQVRVRGNGSRALLAGHRMRAHPAIHAWVVDKFLADPILDGRHVRHHRVREAVQRLAHHGRGYVRRNSDDDDLRLGDRLDRARPQVASE